MRESTISPNFISESEPCVENILSGRWERWMLFSESSCVDTETYLNHVGIKNREKTRAQLGISHDTANVVAVRTTSCSSALTWENETTKNHHLENPN